MYIFRNYDNVPLVASCEFVSYTVKIASGVIDKVKYYYHTAGLKNSTRPLVFMSASGCRASENFDISSEN